MLFLAVKPRAAAPRNSKSAAVKTAGSKVSRNCNPPTLPSLFRRSGILSNRPSLIVAVVGKEKVRTGDQTTEVSLTASFPTASAAVTVKMLSPNTNGTLETVNEPSWASERFPLSTPLSAHVAEDTAVLSVMRPAKFTVAFAACDPLTGLVTTMAGAPVSAKFALMVSD